MALGNRRVYKRRRRGKKGARRQKEREGMKVDDGGKTRKYSDAHRVTD